MSELTVCVIIPTYNNDRTLAQVIDSVLEYTASVMVVNDGSTDQTSQILSRYSDKIEIISYGKNKGKGHALSQGFKRAIQKGYAYALTLDSDGQHFASDIPQFMKTLEANPGALIVGNRNLVQDNMPRKNTFANRFSNFWFCVQTGKKLLDTQTGYRLYPLKKMHRLQPVTSRYEAELEMLVRCAWRGIKIISIPIRVYYAPEGERVSHFRPGADFIRISLLNTLFTLLAFVYGYPSLFIRFLIAKVRRK